MTELGEYYGLTYKNQDIFLYRSFGRKVNNDIDLSNNSILFKLLQKIDSSFILPLSKKNISFLINNLEIKKYNDILKAIFNLANTLLSTETTTTIKREDFLMVGDSATFDTTKRFGTMKGHVHTDVRNGAAQN